MAAEAIVHQKATVIVLLIEENRFVGEPVRAVPPLRGFLLMTFLAAADHGVDIQIAEADGVTVSASNVLDEAASVAQVEAGIEGENLAVARTAGDGAVTGSLPGRVLGADFVAPGAGFSGGVFVVEAGSRNAEDDENAGSEGQKCQARA